MFGNSYQNGHYFEVWDSKATNDKNEAYKHLVRMVPASNKNYFDKDVKSFIYSLQGQNTKMILPAVDQKQLALHQKYLVLHIYIPIGSAWSMELGITDINGIKRRINFTTAQGKSQVKFFSVRYPLDNLQRGCWLFLAFNVYSFIDVFKGQVYRSLDHITVGSNCKIRRIFTMRQWLHWQIPKSFWLGSEIQQQFQLIQYRQLVLPKISSNKSATNQISSPVQVDKTGTIKHSKSNLTRSEIQRPIAKNSMMMNSPGKIVISKIEALQRQKQRIQINSKSNIINQSKIRNISKKQKSPRKSQKILNKVTDKSNSEKIQQKLKNSPKKSPQFEKSFQEDEALNYKPDQDSDINFETSHESFTNIAIRNSRKYEKWQQSPENHKAQPRSPTKQPSQVSQRVSSNVNRTVITKQNNKTKIQTQGKNTELQLIYDEMVGCYYHPQTHTYYEIKQ